MTNDVKQADHSLKAEALAIQRGVAIAKTSVSMAMGYDGMAVGTKLS